MNIIYELAYLISGEFNETQAQELAKKIEKTLSTTGVITSFIEPKKIKLAYPIKKQQEGFLASIDFIAAPEFILLLSKEMEKEADVLRFLIIKKSPEKQKEEVVKKPIEQKVAEESTDAPVMKEKKKKEKPVEKEHKEEDLKKIEKDLDEILGQ